MLPSQKRKSKFQVIIGTPYPLKGMEADAVFVGSFFEKQMDRMVNGDHGGVDEDINIEEEYADILSEDVPEINSGGLAAALENLKASKGIGSTVQQVKLNDTPVAGKEEVKDNQVKKDTPPDRTAKVLSKGTGAILRGLYEEEDAQQEKAVLFVAITRAKQGLFFEDSLFGRAMLDNFLLDKNLNKKRGDDYLVDPDQKKIESLITKEKGLFDNDEGIEKISKIS